MYLDDPKLWQASRHPGRIIKEYYRTHWYNGSIQAGSFKKLICIYLPYNYNDDEAYDLMVLLPGMDMPYSCYLSRAHRYSRELYSVQFQYVLDNLIDNKTIKPMVIVTLPYYGLTIEGHPVMELDGNQLINELRFDLLPYMKLNYSVAADNRRRCGIFGFSYTSSMIMKYIMPHCIDLFSWYGACSVFHSDLTNASEFLNDKLPYFPVDRLDVFCGDQDNAHDQTLEMFHTFCDRVIGIEEKSALMVFENTGHDARTYDTAIVNCLLKFFQTVKIKYGDKEYDVVKDKDEPVFGEWIPVTERLPENNDRFIIASGTAIDTAWYRVKDNEWYSESYDDLPVEYWMPFPKLPGAVEKG